MKLDINTNEQLSCLLDGELDGAHVRPLVDACAQDRALMDTWACYSLIGETLRQGRTASAAAVQSHSPAAVQALAAHAAGVSIAASVSAAPASLAPEVPREAAANDSVFRWRMVAGITGLAAVGALVWSVVGSGLQGQGGAQLAQSQPATPLQAAQPLLVTTTAPGQEPLVMIRDPRLDELMAAHRQFGTASALGQPAGILRANVNTAAPRP